MTDEPPISGNPFQEIIDWPSELETADSYQGFTYTDWLRRRPVEAIETAKATLCENKGKMI